MLDTLIDHSLRGMSFNLINAIFQLNGMSFNLVNPSQVNAVREVIFSMDIIYAMKRLGRSLRGTSFNLVNAILHLNGMSFNLVSPSQVNAIS